MTDNIGQQGRTAAARAALAAALDGKSPRQRGDEKTHRALDWVYRWGYSSAAVIDSLAGTCRSGLTARLAKRGLLVKTRTEAGYGFKNVPAHILTLSQLGLEEIERCSVEHIPYELDPYRVVQNQIRHMMSGQVATAKSLLAGQIADFETERQLAGKSASGKKQPDVCWILPDGGRVAIEIELTGKWKRDFDQFVVASVDSLVRRDGQPPRFARLVIVSDSPALIERYRKAFQPGASVGIWEKDDQRKWVQVRKQSLPAWIEGRVSWHLLT